MSAEQSMPISSREISSQGRDFSRLIWMGTASPGQNPYAILRWQILPR
jgi:hypothetical protein